MPQTNEGRILVVDDHANWVKLVKTVLEEDHHQVVTASSYDEATEVLQTNDFDVAILDMRLVDTQPYNVQGMALLKQIQEGKPETRAVILTGYPDPGQRQIALNVHKADAYIAKEPDYEGAAFDVDAFAQLVQSLVDQKNQ